MMKKFIYIDLLLIILLSCLYFVNIYTAELEEKRQIMHIYKSFYSEDGINGTEFNDSIYTSDASNTYIHELQTNRTSKQETSTILHTEYTENNKNDENDKSDSGLPAGMDCIISIPKIDLEKIVYTGKKRDEHLKNYSLITAASDMKYVNGGNYIICGHASRIYGHSLNRLKELKVGDIVYITYNHQREKYNISSITYETMNNTNQFCEQSEEQKVTILSCAKYIADNKYIVIKCTKP